MKIRARHGFTLVELLTVIAIIAILAAIIFPVFSIVRRNVYRTQCTSNLHSLSQALKMYKDDYRVYPDALFGFDFPYNQGRGFRTFLYPQYIKDRSGLRCPVAPERSTDLTADKLVRAVDPLQGDNSLLTHTGLLYYTWDSYDGSFIPHNKPNVPWVLHYERQWTGSGNMGAADNPRQLIYRNPPDNTVVTWCTYHRSYDANGQPESGSLDLVLFLDGRVKPIPTNRMVPEQNAHAVTPSP